MPRKIDSCLQPTSQIVYNTLYFQKLLEIEEKNLNIPINEYLSKVVNLNLNAVVDSNYIEYENVQGFLNTILREVNTNSNCLLNGFEVGVDRIDNHIIDVKVYPGAAILNNFMIEMYEPVIFTIDTSINIDLENYVIVLAPANNDYSLKHFKILYYLLDENNNPIIEDDFDSWDNERFLPIGLIKITERSYDSNILSLESFGVPINISTNNNLPLYDVNNALMYDMLNLSYVESFKNKTVLGTKSLTPLYVPPKIYTINNYDYVLPNYGEHINNGYFMFKQLYNYDYFALNWINSSILSFNKYFSNIF